MRELHKLPIEAIVLTLLLLAIQYGLAAWRLRNLLHKEGAHSSIGVALDAVVIGVRAFNERKDFKEAFPGLLAWVEQGGTVIAATSPFKANLASGSLTVSPVQSGLDDWLASHGITLEKKMVMDPKNAALPVPVNRNLGGLTVQDWRMLDYPYFPDLRDDSLNDKSPITSSLPQVTLAWSSPITLDAAKANGRNRVASAPRPCGMARQA